MNFSGGNKRPNNNINSRFSLKPQLSLKKQPSIKLNNHILEDKEINETDNEPNNEIINETNDETNYEEKNNLIEDCGEMMDIDFKINPLQSVQIINNTEPENINFGTVYEIIDNIPMTMNPMRELRKKQSMKDVVDLVLEKYIRKPKTW